MAYPTHIPVSDLGRPRAEFATDEERQQYARVWWQGVCQKHGLDARYAHSIG